VITEAKPMVCVSRNYTESTERVFDAWLDKTKAANFFFATPEGEMVCAEIDPRVGGSFMLVDRRNGIDVEHIGVYLEIDRPHRLSFILRVPHYHEESTRVSIGFVQLERGCELILTQEGPEFVSSTEEGWRAILDALDDVLS